MKPFLKHSLLIFVALVSVALFILLTPCFTKQVSAQAKDPSLPNDEFMKATVVQIVGEKKNPLSAYNQTFQIVEVTVLDGPDAGKTIQVEYDPQNISDLQLHTGDTVVVDKTFDSATKVHYTINDKYRIPGSIALIVLFVLVFLVIVGWKGIGSLIGLAISLTILFFYVVPQILAGQNPLFVCFLGAVAILFLTTYIAHGFSKQTTIAVIGTFIALLCSVVIAIIAAHIAIITGYGDENARSIHFGTKHLIDVKGLLLGGIIIGTIGALNDVTTTQTATMFELAKAHKNFTFQTIVKQGILVGKEHVISLINTLVLAYAGSSLAIFIFFFYNASYFPVWVILNSEYLNEELIRTFAGTMSLMLVVPIVTFLAAFWLTREHQTTHITTVPSQQQPLPQLPLQPDIEHVQE